MATIKLANGNTFTGTARECAEFAQAMQAPKSKSLGKKVQMKGKSIAPATRTEAIANWKEDKNITTDTQAAYNALYEKRWAKDWAKWQALGKHTSAENKAKAKEIRNAYRKQVGIKALEK